MIEVFKLKKDEELWNGYVYSSSDTTFYHQLAWRDIIKDLYGFKPIYLVAKDRDAIRGILPMFLIKSRLFGMKLISIPFAPYGGVCADDELIERMLIEEAKKIADTYDVDYLELRGFKEFGLLADTRYYTFILKLERDHEVVWRRLSKKVRNSTRKAIKSGLRIEKDGSYLKDFYNVYSRNMHSLGTPTHSLRFFKKVLRKFSEKTDLVVVRYGDEVVAGAILLRFKDTVISGWAGSLRSYLKFCPNNMMYWTIIRDACKDGYKYFDFGRSLANSGTFRFKIAWAAEPIRLNYQFYTSNYVPDTSMQNPKRRKFAEFWRKIPYPIANAFGHMLRRYFP